MHSQLSTHDSRLTSHDRGALTTCLLARGYPSGRRAHPSPRVIIHLDPMSIRILKVNLFDAIDANGGSFRSAGPVGVFDFMLVKIGDKAVDGFYTEAKVIVLVALDICFGSLDKVEMTCNTQC